MLKTLVFDIDGTLIHLSEDYILKTVNLTLSKLGLPAAKISDCKKFWFGHSRDLFIAHSFNAEPQNFWKAFLEADSERMENIRLYDDVGVLKELKEQGLKIGFLTGTKHQAIPHYLKKLEFLGLDFENEILVSDQLHNFPPKPDPQGLNHCLKLLKANAAESAYIGNADEDVIVARNAGVLDIIIDRKELQLSEKPSFKISKLEELKSIINSEKK